MAALAKVLNFSIVFQEPPSGNFQEVSVAVFSLSTSIQYKVLQLILNCVRLGELWGKRLPNGTWDGLVGMMARNEAYMGLVNSFISDNNDRLDEIEYSKPYDADWQSLALPFTPYVWVGVVVAFLCTSPFLFWLAKGGEARGESFRRLDDSFLCAWGIQLREPQTFFPSCTSTRILLASMWLSSVILTIAYSSHLTAFLTIARRPPVLQTFKELYEANIEVASIGEFFNVSMAATGNYYLQTNLVSKALVPECGRQNDVGKSGEVLCPTKGLTERYSVYKSFEEASVYVKLGREAFISGRKNLEYRISTQIFSSGRPTLTVMKECFAPHSIGVALQRHTPLRRSLDRALEWMVESGLVTHWFSQALSRQRKSTNVDSDQTASNERDYVTALNLDHMQGIFLILTFGHLASCAVFAVELLRGKMRAKRQ
nr:glutamate receptor 2-like [Penaeus vannamei]